MDLTERANESHDLRPGSPEAPLWDPTAIPAATAIVLRDGLAGVEVLMLKRNRNLAFAGGMWVFPGGRIDPEDFPHSQAGSSVQVDIELAAEAAAVREAQEEAGLRLEQSELMRWSHWTPPPETPKRFSTAFFIAPWQLDSGEVTVDDGEIREHRWEQPAQVLELRASGEVGLTPPTFITLSQLLPFDDVSGVFNAAKTRPQEHFATRIALDGEEVIAMYHGDAGYVSGDPTTTGPRHRLVMGSHWHYQRDAQTQTVRKTDTRDKTDV